MNPRTLRDHLPVFVPVVAFLLALFMTAVHTAIAAPKRGWLGVAVQEITPSLQKALELGDRKGLMITEVMDDSPAERAGLLEEDVILRYDGEPVSRISELRRLVRRTSPGTEVTLRIWRDGKEMDIRATIGKLRRRASDVFIWRGPGKTLEIFSGYPRLGVQVHELNPDLARYFEVDDREGVLVLEVEEDSPAEKAGLKAGDVIVRVEGEKVRDADDLRDILTDYEDGDEVAVEIVRRGKRKTLTVTLERGRFFSNWVWPSFPRFPRFDDGCGDNVIIIRPDMRHRLHRIRMELQERKHRLQRIKREAFGLINMKMI